MSMETGSAAGRRFNGGWNLNRRRRSRRIGAGDHHILGDYAARGQKLIWKPPFCAVLNYMAPSVLTLVTLRYQSKTEGLFEKNPAPTWCFLAAACVYGLIAGIMDQIQTFETKCSQILRRAAIASVVSSMISPVPI